eukprot:COSAG01_NODE_51149_length_357_cov_0.732558_1_plen_40_part_01
MLVSHEQAPCTELEATAAQLCAVEQLHRPAVHGSTWQALA